MPSKTFKDLIVWKKAHQWVLEVYRFTDFFPVKEQFGLTSQLRRAAISIPANIAEGFKKRGNPDKARFYNIAQGSVEECRYYLILARDLGYGDTSTLEENLEEISRLLEVYARRVVSSQ
jgi:four helix bundle protein